METTDNLTSITKLIQSQQDSANSANLKRYDQMMTIYDEIIKRYAPGGTFGTSFEQLLASQKERDVGQSKQDLISSGLFGSESLAGTGNQWEASVGAPARLKMEDLRMERLSNAQIGKADAIERRTDTGPDYDAFANLMTQAAQRPSGNTGTASTTSNWGVESRLASMGGRSSAQQKTIDENAAAEAERQKNYSATLAAQGGVGSPTPAEGEENLGTVYVTNGFQGKRIYNATASKLAELAAQGYKPSS